VVRSDDANPDSGDRFLVRLMVAQPVRCAETLKKKWEKD
jgi:hypothetical protein